jgi:WD40 repeat protein
MRHLFFLFFLLFTGSMIRSQTLIVHPKKVFDFALSPDGKHLVYTDYNSLETWGTDPFNPVRRFETVHKGRITAVAFSNQGDRIVSGGQDGLIIIMDLFSGDYRITGTGQSGTILSVKFSPNDSVVASASDDNTIFIRNLLEPESPHVLKDPGNSVTDVEFLDDRLLLSTGSNGKIAVWDLKENIKILEWRAHRGWIRDLALNSNHQELASCGDDSRIKIWDISRLEQVSLKSILREGGNWLMSLNYSEENFLGCCGDNRKIKIHSALNGSYSFKSQSNLKKVQFVPGKNPFKLVYLSLSEGLWLLKSEEMKFSKDKRSFQSKENFKNTNATE